MVSPPSKTIPFNPDNYTCTLKSSICMQNAPQSCRHETQRNSENNENYEHNENNENNENNKNNENNENNDATNQPWLWTGLGWNFHPLNQLDPERYKPQNPKP